MDAQPDRQRYDAIVVGRAGGSTLAYQLSRSGIRVLVIERGGFLRPERVKAAEPVGKYMHHFVKNSREASFFVGGQTKFYGSALYRMRERDFGAAEHEMGVSPAWLVNYSDLEPYYEGAEMLYRVHGSPDGDLSEPPRARPFPYPPIRHEPVVSKIVGRIEQSGTRVSAVPLGLDYGPEGRCVLCSTCDRYYCQLDAKMDAEIAALRPALASGLVHLMEQTDCLRVLTTADGARATGVVVRHLDRERIIHADVVAVCAGVTGSSALLRRSRTPKHPDGLGNATGCLGRYLAGHSAGLIFPFMGWKQVPPAYTKTFAINGYYDGAPEWPYPVGVIQMAGQMPFWEQVPKPLRPFARLLGTPHMLLHDRSATHARHRVDV